MDGRTATSQQPLNPTSIEFEAGATEHTLNPERQQSTRKMVCCPTKQITGESRLKSKRSGTNRDPSKVSLVGAQERNSKRVERTKKTFATECGRSGEKKDWHGTARKITMLSSTLNTSSNNKPEKQKKRSDLVFKPSRRSNYIPGKPKKRTEHVCKPSTPRDKLNGRSRKKTTKRSSEPRVPRTMSIQYSSSGGKMEKAEQKRLRDIWTQQQAEWIADYEKHGATRALFNSESKKWCTEEQEYYRKKQEWYDKEAERKLREDEVDRKRDSRRKKWLRDKKACEAEMEALQNGLKKQQRLWEDEKMAYQRWKSGFDAERAAHERLQAEWKTEKASWEDERRQHQQQQKKKKKKKKKESQNQQSRDDESYSYSWKSSSTSYSSTPPPKPKQTPKPKPQPWSNPFSAPPPRSSTYSYSYTSSSKSKSSPFSRSYTSPPPPKASPPPPKPSPSPPPPNASPLRKWLHTCTTTFTNPHTVTSLPEPPSIPCSEKSCQTAGTRRLKACIHSLQQTFKQEFGNDGKEIRKWRNWFHPNNVRFNSVVGEERKRGVLEGVGEVFVALDGVLGGGM